MTGSPFSGGLGHSSGLPGLGGGCSPGIEGGRGEGCGRGTVGSVLGSMPGMLVGSGGGLSFGIDVGSGVDAKEGCNLVERTLLSNGQDREKAAATEFRNAPVNGAASSSNIVKS